MSVYDIYDIIENHYLQHKISVINSIEKILMEDPETYANEFRAFNRLVYDCFSDAPFEGYVLTDGNDQGIDCYTKADRSYEVFQCKFASLENILKSESPIAFDDEGVKDLENACKYLLEEVVPDTPNKLIKSLRGQIVSKGFDNIAFNLCVFGYLTEDAGQKFEAIKKKYESSYENININLLTWKDVILYIIKETSPIHASTHKFNIYKDKILSDNDYCYFIGYAKDFRDAFQHNGWSLFDLNVRSEIRKSRVNKEIVGSIVKSKSRRKFHHLNNGLLLICKNYSIPEKKDHITINDFQIINGCQTVVSINKGFDQISNDKMKVDDFNEKCFVQVKVIKRNPDILDIVDQLVVSTNNQNPMSLRNLKSNTQEQKDIKTSLYHLPKKWFYQRKDGEFDALKSGIVEGFDFKKSDYKEQNSNAYRVIDNQDLAKTWTCFCGFSTQAMMTSDFFRDEKLYDRIFAKYPTERLWKEFLDPEIDLEPEDNYFEIKQPTAEEYLISYIIWEFIKEYATKPIQNREMALLRGVKAKKLQQNNKGDITNSQEDQARYLIQDQEYMINNIINNSKEVMLEMYSFIIAHKYGTGYEIIKDLLKKDTFSTLVFSPDFKSYVNIMSKNKDNILYSIYEFLKFVSGQLYLSISGEYAASSRRKSYLATPYFVKLFKKKIVEMDSYSGFKNMMTDWKVFGKSFFDSMPNL